MNMRICDLPKAELEILQKELLAAYGEFKAKKLKLDKLNTDLSAKALAEFLVPHRFITSYEMIKMSGNYLKLRDIYPQKSKKRKKDRRIRTAGKSDYDTGSLF